MFKKTCRITDLCYLSFYPFYKDIPGFSMQLKHCWKDRLFSSGLVKLMCEQLSTPLITQQSIYTRLICSVSIIHHFIPSLPSSSLFLTFLSIHVVFEIFNLLFYIVFLFNHPLPLERIIILFYKTQRNTFL